MFRELLALGVRKATIYRVSIADGAVETLIDQTGTSPDGVVVEDGAVYWTTMGKPTQDPSLGIGEKSREVDLECARPAPESAVRARDPLRQTVCEDAGDRLRCEIEHRHIGRRRRLDPGMVPA